MPRPIVDKIIKHEDNQPYVDFLGFVQGYWRENFDIPLKDIAGATGLVNAYISNSRWIAACPEDCGGAMVVTPDFPFLMCVEPDCGNVDNGGEWYNIEFPVDRAEIEVELVKRRRLHRRIWAPGETLNDIRQENRDHGLD